MLPEVLSLDESVRQRLKVLLEQQSTVCAGQIAIVGLDAIRADFGEDWGRYRDRVHAYFEKVAATILAPSEVSLRLSDDRYVVVFHDRDQAASQMVCKKILSEVHDTFLGTPELTGLSLDSVVMTLDPESLARSLGVELAPQSAFAGGNSDPAPAVKSAATTVAREKLPFDERTEAVWYLPVWDLENKLVYSFLPTIIRNRGRRRVAGYDALPSSRDPAAIRALDLHILTRALHDLTAFCETGGKAFIVASVHYETLEHNESRVEIHRQCLSAPDEVRSRIIFQMTGLTPGRPAWRVQEYAAMLAQLGRLVTAQIDARWDPLERLRDLPIQGVTVKLDDDFRAADRIARDLARIQAFCSANRLFLAIGGVYSLDLASAARRFGAKFLSGHYVLGAVDRPQAPMELEWMDIYSLLGGVGTPGDHAGAACQTLAAFRAGFFTDACV